MQNNKSKQNQAKNEILTDWQRIEMVIQQSKLTGECICPTHRLAPR